MSIVDKQLAVNYPLPYQTVFNIAQQTLSNIRGYRYDGADPYMGMIRLTTRVNFMTWGEDVRVRMSAIDANNTRIDISSEPRVATTLIDWGRNRRNVNKILQILTQALSAYMQSPH